MIKPIFTPFLLLVLHQTTGFTSRLIHRSRIVQKLRNNHLREHHWSFQTKGPSATTPPATILHDASSNAASSTPPLRGRQKIPTILTVARCGAIPPLLWTFYKGPVVGAVAIFVAASLTDLLDGYLARRWKATSAFGAFLDPVADKLMVAAVLLPLSGKYGAPVAVPAALILMREIGVSALREWMASQQVRNVVQVGMLGKIKTSCTMVSLTLFLLEPLYPSVYKASLALMWLCSVVTVWSGALYLFAALPYF